MAINVPLNAQLQNATQLQQQVQNAVNAVRINLGGANGARSLSALSQPLGRLTGQADEFTKSLDAANARVLAFGASVGVVNAVSNAFKALVSSTIEVEKALTEISVVGDQFNGKTKQLSQGLFDIAKNTGQSFAEVSRAALEFSRQGLNLEETLARTKDALILTRTTGLDAAKSVEGLSAAVSAFAKAGLSTAQVINKLGAVDKAFKVSSADLIQAFERTGAVAQQAGVSFDELAGIVTALQSDTSRGGAVIGNALKTIFSRLQDTSTLTQLQNLGIAVEDLQGNVLPARQILQNLANDIQGLSKLTQAGIFKDVAGTFQLNQLVSLVNDLGRAQGIAAKATEISSGATNEAYIANEKLNQSLDAILNKLATTGKQFGALLGEIGFSDNLKGILDGINNFIEQVTDVLQGDDLGSKFAKGIVKGIGSVLSGPGFMVFLAIIAKLSFDLAKFGTQSLKTFFNIGKAANDQKQIQESIVQVLLKNQNVLNQILSTQGGQNAQAQAFLGILNQQAAAMQTIQGLAGNMTGAVYSAGYRQTEKGLQRTRGQAAGGYLPAQEAADVRRGVGGASPSSKVVAIPNFAFGGGKRGTMIANTSEYIVPNYAGGGSAIFNPDMVKTMGLPAGAKKISAAGGFIPNFTKKIEDFSKKYALITNNVGDTALGATFSYKPKGAEEPVFYKANIYGIDPSKFKAKDGSNIYFKRFSSNELERRYTSFAVKDAKNFAEKAIGLPISPVSIQNLTNAGSVPSVVGTIFETAIQSILTDEELINKIREDNQNALFDFVSPATAKIGQLFGIQNTIPYLEAKSSASPSARKSFAKKIYQEELAGNPMLSSKKDLHQKISGPPLTIRPSNFSEQLQKVSGKNFKAINLTPEQINQLEKAGGQLKSSSQQGALGYIPNFAASALQDAITREKRAGLSDSQIYIDQNPSLKSPQNPMGLMVANTRDEPFGGIQGISRARKEGMNPKLYGAANGFVPNYAPMLSGYAASLNQPANTNNSEKVNKGFGEMAGKIFLLQGALSFMSGAVGEATTSFEKFTQQAAISLGNISSLAIFGKEIRGINIEATGMKGALGKFAKNAGLAGVAIGIAVEGFDFLNFAIKEFSGENEKAALASAKLADASDKLSIKFESLSKTRQTQVSTQAEKILGSAGYEGFWNGIANFFRTEKIGGGDVGANTEVKKGIAQLLALGASRTEIDQILKSAKKTEKQKKGKEQETYEADITQASDVIAGLEKSMTDASGLGKKLNDKFLEFSSQIEGIDFNATDANGAIKKIQDKIYGPSVSSELTATLEEEVQRQEQDFKIKLAKQTLEFEKPINVLKRALGTIIFESGLAIEKISQQLERESQIISAITSSKSFATLGDSSRIAFEINSSIDQFQKQYKNQISKFTQETQKSLLEYIPQLGIGQDNSAIIEKQVKAVGAATTKEGLQSSLGTFQEQLKNFGVNLDLPKFEELKNKITETVSNFDNLNQNLNVQEKILALQNQERILEAQAYDTYRNNLAGFVEQTVKSAKSIAALRGEIERIAITQESNITARTAVSKTGREDVIIRGEEELKAFRDRRDKETAILFEEQAMAAKQQFFTKENIAELNRNTEALNDLRMVLAQDFINKIDDSIKVVQGMTANTTGPSVFKGGSTPLSTGITLPSGINNTQDALNYLQNLRRAYSPSAPGLNTGVNLTTAEADLNKITAAIRGGSSFADVQDQINTLSKNEVYVNQLTEYARKMYEAAQTSAATMEENETTLKEQVKANIRNYDIINSYGTKLNNSLKSVRDSLTDPQTRGELLSKLGVIRRGVKEQGLGTEAEKRNYRSSFGYGFDEAMDKLRARTEDFRNQLGQEIPDLFSQNLAQGLNDAISGAKTLKEALMDAATSFFQEITRKNISNLADLVTGRIGNLVGGFFQPSIPKAIPVGPNEYASGGLIKGGSGTKDDVPAMLMGGEYVVKKSAVNKYGKGFFDAINGGRMRGYAAGGMVDPQTFPTQTGRGGFFTPGDYGQGAITGKNELLTFASQSFTGGQYDYMGGFGMGGATVSLEPESARLSALGREGSPMFERVQQSKDEAFKVYLEGLQKEKEYAELLDQISKAEKARKKQLQTAIISAVVSSALSYVGNKYFPQGSKKPQGSKEYSLLDNPEFRITRTTSQRPGQPNVRMSGAASYSTGSNNISNLPLPTSVIQPIGPFRGGYIFPQQSASNLLLMNNRASGGLISGGSNIRDDVPAMLTGGEFVLNNRATQRIGLQNLNRLNSGAPVSSEGSSPEMTQTLIAKLDELIQTTANSSKENVVVNVSTNEAGGQTTENPTGTERDLQKKIRQAVLDVIAQEKRLGGSLEKSR